MLPSPYQVLSCQRIILAVRRGFGSYIFIYGYVGKQKASRIRLFEELLRLGESDHVSLTRTATTNNPQPDPLRKSPTSAKHAPLLQWSKVAALA